MSPDRSARRRAPTLAGIGVRIGFVAVLALVAANAFLAWIALGAVETRLEPVIKDKAHVLARSIANDLNTAVRLDIPVEGLRGVDAYLEDLLTDHPEVAYLAVTDAEGKVLFSAEAREGVDVSSHPFAANAGAFVSIGSDYNIAHPLVHGGKQVGHAMVGIDRRYVRNTMAGIFTDIGISLCVAILIVLELTLLVLSLTVARSIGLMRRLMHAVSEGDFSASIASRGRDDLARVIDAMNGINTEINRRFRALVAAGGTVERLREGRVFAEAGAYRPVQVLRAGDVQYPLFFFIFGVELSRPFFPLFVRDLYDPSLGIDASIAIAMPMSVWVVAMLFTTPLAPTLIRRLGTRNTLLLGMAPTSVGLIATAFATGFVELIAWRCVTAAGFGLVTAAILVRLAITAPERRRALNIGVFVTATGGGSICATAIGGILAERLGYENTFIVGATIVFVAMTITFGFLSSEEGVGTRVGAQAHRRRFGIYGSPRFMTFMALSALPSRTVLTGFLFFLVPLYLDSLDFGGAAIGRTMMVYFLVLLVMNQAAALIADRFQNHGMLIVVGGISVAAGCLLFVSTTDALLLACGVALIGLGQSFVMTPQVAVLPTYFRSETEAFGTGPVTAAFRVVERAGSIAGPLLAGSIVAFAGLQHAGRLLGYGIAATTLLLALLLAVGVFTRRR
ncbi:MAG: MFS transporter [Alphaproteobacteria bacterium]|nr:MFS transporter [Alphaproteobacteria bacterium]